MILIVQEGNVAYFLLNLYIEKVLKTFFKKHFGKQDIKPFVNFRSTEKHCDRNNAYIFEDWCFTAPMLVLKIHTEKLISSIN